jgi:hypothetical protein
MIMSKWKVLTLAAVLVFALSVPVFAASPWISVISPNPEKIWQKSTESMVPNTEPLAIWQSGKEYMVVWEFADITGNVQVELLKDGKVVTVLSPAGGIPVGANGRGFQEMFVFASAGSGHYQIRVSSLQIPDISSLSQAVLINVK